MGFRAPDFKLIHYPTGELMDKAASRMVAVAVW